MEHSICSYYNGCRVSFKDLIATLQNPARDFSDQIAEPAVRDEHGRFEVWAGNVGARHAPKSRVSLDHRLRESSFYRERVIRLLKDLEDTLQNATSLLKAHRKPIEECATPLDSPPESDTDESEYGSEKQDEDEWFMGEEGNNPEPDALRLLLERQETTPQLPSGTPAAPPSDSFNTNRGAYNLNPKTPEMTQLSQGIRSLVGHLYKLSMLIRRPIPHDRLTKCNSIDVSHYESFESAHILNCFPTLNEILRLRLAHAMKRRRQYLIYSRRHHHALANPKSAPPLEDVFVERLPETQVGEAVGANKPVATPPRIETTNLGIPDSRFGTNTEATQFVPLDNSDEDRPPSDLGTVSTYASTTFSDEKVRIPPRPQGPDGKELEQFECPYCLHIVETKTVRAWKLHVLRDLRPYVCTFEQCNSSENMFENRSEWFSHEMQFHRKDWSCNILGHGTYQHQSEFEDHIRRDHSNWFVESQLPSLIAMFGRPSQALLASCPFCNEAHQEFKEEDQLQPVLTEEGEPIIRRDPVFVPTGKIKRHIARHLERLALFSIPAPDYGDGDMASLNSDDVDKASSESRSELLESEYPSSNPIKPIVQETNEATSEKDDYSLTLELLPKPKETKVKLPCRIIKPYHKNPHFVGRRDVSDQIRQALAPGKGARTYRQVFTLCGSGGVGKTQTALNYVFEYMDEFQVVLWAHASNHTQLLESFSGFAIDLGLVSGEDEAIKDPYAYKGILKRWLDTTETPWLLVLDGADAEDGMDVLKEYLPTGVYGSTLITSRDSTLVPKYGGVVLGELGENDAAELLLKSTTSTSHDHPNTDVVPEVGITAAARSIVGRLGYLPIGIIQAAQFINKKNLQLEEFLDEYNERELIGNAESMQLENPSQEDYPFNLSTVWTMSYKTLHPDQQDLLNLMAFFDPMGIPLQLLSDGAIKASSLGVKSLNFIDTDRKFKRCKSGLVKSSLVMQNEFLEQLWMHRLVQQSCHLWMDHKTRQDAFDRALGLLQAIWPMSDPDDRHHVELWPLQNLLLPHLQSLARFYDLSQSTEDPLAVDQFFLGLLFEAALWVFFSSSVTPAYLCSFCYERGVNNPVIPLVDIAERYSQRSDEDCNLRMADIYFARGCLENEANLREECFQSFTKQYDCIQACIASGEIKSPDAREALSCGQMGNGCMALDRFQEAEAWYLKAFDIWDRLSRPSEDRKIYVSNIGVCYTNLGKLHEATEVLSPNIKDWDDVSSLKTAILIYGLGNVQIRQGKFDEAFKTHLQAYKLFKTALGDRHHRTADGCHKIGWHFHHQGKYGNAIAMLQQALDVYNDDTNYQNESARTMYKLGRVKLDNGEVESGTALVEEAILIYSRIFPGRPLDSLGEGDFDKLVIAWSR